MVSKSIGIAGIATVVCALFCTTSAQQPARIPNTVEEQKQPQLLPTAGRYQIIADNFHVIVVDTHTGHCWTKSVSAQSSSWKDLGLPGSTE